MTLPSTTRLHELISAAIGPTPWYWKTFPAFTSQSGQRFVWNHQDEPGPVQHVVSLNLEHVLEKPRLALNTYCRPFLVPPHRLGIWCPEGRSIRVVCFDPDQLKAFDLSEVAGWFKQSSERIFAHTAPIAEFEVPVTFPAGTHKIDVPAELASVVELLVPTSYPAASPDDPAFALFILYPHAGLVEVLPQNWFTSARFDVGYQWIARAARDPESYRIVGDGIRVEPFLLDEDGRRLERWLEKNS
jgi:hypothetical protein